ncbi:MAG TPA: hypothetical protein VEY67_10860 [Candidatus Dormibacteraeota bacterium]|nr:hypothetical protein [Candidatus Dormibacteraeota bacterium]
MASTETRTGFRLPWVSDAHAADDPATESGPDEVALTDAPAGEAPAAEGDVAQAESAIDRQDTSPATRTPGATAAGAAGSPRRPTKFLADLARAMHAAAEAERQDILERFQADAKAFVEGIHERSAVEATEIRTAADGDIAGIRDWSKAEIARIREETEHRIADRRTRLEAEIDAHAARIERQIDRVHATVGTFEAEMARFFETLLSEDDPTEFAALASSLPEPPPLDEVAASSLDETVPATAEAQPAHATTEAAVEPEAVTAPVDLPNEPQGAPVAAAAPESTDPSSAEASVATLDEPAPDETATAATLVADETADATVDTTDPSSSATIDGSAVADEGAVADASETSGEHADGGSWPTAGDELQLDPRVAALGLTPDFGAAEAEAAAGLVDDLPDDGSSEEIVALDDETIASRLAGLVPAAPADTDSVETAVAVSGLVSVASIAGFKRALGRLEGVHTVSVSSGPDGEFVFSVGGSATVDLAAAITTLPGFAARVVGSSEGRLDVTAHDPDAA